MASGVVAFSLPAIGCKTGEARYVVEEIRHHGDRSWGRTVEVDLAGLSGIHEGRYSKIGLVA